MRARLLVTTAALCGLMLGCEAQPVAPAAPVAKPAPTPVSAEAAPVPKDSCPSWATLDAKTLPALPATPHTATFEQVWRTVLEKHFDPTLGCQDWPALRLEFGQKLGEARDAAGAYATMNELLGTLKQSHFKVVPPSGAAPTAASGPARAPIHVREIGDEVVVVDPALGGVDSGVPRGAVIVAIDDKPIAEIVGKAEAEALRPDEVAFQTMIAVEGAMHGATEAKRKITFKDPTKADTEVTREVTCVVPAGEMVTIGNLQDIPTDRHASHDAGNEGRSPRVQLLDAADGQARRGGDGRAARAGHDGAGPRPSG